MKILRQRFLEHVAQTSHEPLMIEVARAEGVFLWTPPTEEFPEGQRFFDLISGVSVSNVGHGRPEVVRAVQAQAAAYMHTMVYGETVMSPQVRYAARLAELLPAELQSVYFVNSGAEAVEGALKLAKRTTGRREILAFRGAYHGSTHGALSVMSRPEGEVWRAPFEPLLPEVDWLIFNDFEGLGRIGRQTACVLVEPVQGEGGVRLPAPGFLAALRQRCDETGALLIFDEIQTGMGRAGGGNGCGGGNAHGGFGCAGQGGRAGCHDDDGKSEGARCGASGTGEGGGGAGGGKGGNDGNDEGGSGNVNGNVNVNGNWNDKGGSDKGAGTSTSAGAGAGAGASNGAGLFAFEKYGVVPDIMCVAKALGGGMPLGAFISSREIMGTLSHDPALGHITTFGGHPVCCAAGLAALEVIMAEGLAKAAEWKGAVYEELIGGHPAVREIRRAGLLAAVELGDTARLMRLMRMLRRRGIMSDWFLFCDTAFRISPPLVITEDEIRESCDIILGCLDEL